MKSDYTSSALRGRLASLLKKNKYAEAVIIFLVFVPAGILLWAGYALNKPFLGFSSILFAVFFIQGLLWLREESWRKFGLKRPRSWLRTSFFSLLAAVILHLLLHFIFIPFVVRITGKVPDLSRFEELRGNLEAFIFMLFISWTLAAFGEEMIFRGFLLNSLASLFRNKKAGWTVAVVVSSVIFAAGHFYQGISGILLTGIIGLLYSLLYLWEERNLWMLILTHGIYDSAAFMVIYFNLDKILP